MKKESTHIKTKYMATEKIKISKILLNEGQLRDQGLPQNPRFIRDERFEALKKSIQDDPEMLALRELIVFPIGDDKYITIGGNMRLRACRDLGYKEMICKVLPADTPMAKLRAIIIKDNEAFGQNDWDILADEFELEELKDFGFDTSFLASFGGDIDLNLKGDEDGSEGGSAGSAPTEFSVTFVFPEEEREAVERYLKENGKDGIVEMITSLAHEEE